MEAAGQERRSVIEILDSEDGPSTSAAAVVPLPAVTPGSVDLTGFSSPPKIHYDWTKRYTLKAEPLADNDDLTWTL